MHKAVDVPQYWDCYVPHYWDCHSSTYYLRCLHFLVLLNSLLNVNIRLYFSLRGLIVNRELFRGVGCWWFKNMFIKIYPKQIPGRRTQTGIGRSWKKRSGDEEQRIPKRLYQAARRCRWIIFSDDICFTFFSKHAFLCQRPTVLTRLFH